MDKYGVVVVGASAGGRAALSEIFSQLPRDFSLPILVAQHLSAKDKGEFIANIQTASPLKVAHPDDKMMAKPGNIYFAPADYHMLLEADGSISLNVDSSVLGSRPSIDLLFKSAAASMGSRIVGVILSGANSDGAAGMKAIAQNGGLTLAQDPAEAEFPFMPRAAILAAGIKNICSLKSIARKLEELTAGANKQEQERS